MIANERKSTTVEITIGYLTKSQIERLTSIYNSRNYYRLLNEVTTLLRTTIYNSRNYYRLLNIVIVCGLVGSTTVEITIGYLTCVATLSDFPSTTVEITIGYLTTAYEYATQDLQQ